MLDISVPNCTAIHVNPVTIITGEITGSFPIRDIIFVSDKDMNVRVTAFARSDDQLLITSEVKQTAPITAAPGLLVALNDLIRAYVGLLENGRDRILFLGGKCDSVEEMERDDPNLIAARAVVAKAMKSSV